MPRCPGLGIERLERAADHQELFVEVVGMSSPIRSSPAKASTMFCLWVRLDIRSNSSGRRRCKQDVAHLAHRDAIARIVGKVTERPRVGYGGTVEVPAIDMIFSEIAVIGSLVGNYNELVELMTMAGQGRVTLHASEYSLADINGAIDDLDHGRVQGRGVIVP